MKLTPLALFIYLWIGLFVSVPLSVAEEEQAMFVYRFGGESECRQCWSYSLQIFSSGRVLYEGPVAYYVLRPRTSQTERGKRETTIPTESINKWSAVLENEIFFSLLPKYRGDSCAMDGRPESTLTAIANGNTKTVVWVDCPEGDAPLWLRQVAKDIREQVNSDQWVKIVPDPYRRERWK